MSRRLALTTCGVAVTVLLAGCGSSSTTSTPATTTPSTSAATGTASSGAPSGPATLPAVSGATDLKAEPRVDPSSGRGATKLLVRTLVAGTGKVAGPSATVKVQYVGALYPSGKVFDASWTDSGPATFPLSGVVPGFKDAIVGMKVGGRREVVIPPALGYGAAGSPPAVPGNATLTFVIDLLAVS